MAGINKQEQVGDNMDSLSHKDNDIPFIQSVLKSETSGLLEGVEQFDIQKVFTSQRFIDGMKKINENIRGEAIGKALEYAILHPDGFEFWEFIRNLENCAPKGTEYELDESVRSIFTQSVIRKLKINDVESMESKIQLIDYCVEHLVKNGIYFHGFNGIFEKQIREQGLTQHERQWDWSELQRIQEIGEKTGNAMILGWALLNCEGKTSLSENARSTYRYATVSPEWFAQFTCEGFHIPVEGQRKTAFHRRHYEDARSNVLLLCDQMMSKKQEDIDARRAYPNITESEKEEILAFFEKYWQKLAGPDSTPKVALVKERAIFSHPDEFKDYVEWYREFLVKKSHTMTPSHIIGLFFSKLRSDIQIQTSIPKESLTVIDLPEYGDIFPDGEF